MRLARHARRFGRDALPVFSDDSVVQFCVEEALMEKLEQHERRLEEEAARRRSVADAQRRVQATLEQRQREELGR